MIIIDVVHLRFQSDLRRGRDNLTVSIGLNSF